MAESVTIRTNIPDFRRQLKELGARFERRVAARAVRAAAAVFRDEARRLAPVLKKPTPGRVAGALRRAIFVRGRRGRKGTVTVSVGVKAEVTIGRGASKTVADPFYWRFLEGGWIPRGPGKKVKGGTRRRALERYRALQAGARKIERPFLAPAFKNAGGPALEAFNRTIAEGIAQESARVR